MQNRVYEEDRALVASLLAGDRRSFRLFFDAYAQRLASFVMRRTSANPSTAEDIVQSAMIKAVRGLRNYRAEASLYTWLCTICRSEIADQRRRDGRTVPAVSMDSDDSVSGKVAQLQGPSEFEFGPAGAEADPTELVAKALARLPARYASVLESKYGDGLSVVEVARELGLSAAATQSLLARAREAFRQAWQDEHGNSESPLDEPGIRNAHGQ
jgi:RNA polymerase sigma-70 factor (ECF subfamily)